LKLNYRADIDGLRALAVVPVCCYHLGITMFPGGFVGVDVFFTISGYLMASLIGQGLSQGDFSFSKFFERRARRILPALFFVTLVCIALALVMFPPKLLRDFGSTVAATIFFSSNVIFWKKSANYFDLPAEWDPLLHTWSLAVEEQFYILYPVFMVLIWRLGRVTRLGAVMLVAVTSFALSVWGVANAPTATFYLIPTRAWELLIGAGVALWCERPTQVDADRRSSGLFSSVLGWTGVALVCGSIGHLNSETPYPGGWALLPCVGAALIISAGRDNLSSTARLLAVRPLVAIGKISYSLYLWHWPIIVFAEKHQQIESGSSSYKALLLSASIIMGYASWRWVEQPFRDRSFLRPAPLIGSLAATGIVLSLVGLFSNLSNGWPARFPGVEAVSLERQASSESSNPDWEKFGSNKCLVQRLEDWSEQNCFLSHNADQNALLWGDSFAASYAYGFFVAHHPNFNVLQYTFSLCPPIFGYEATLRSKCASFNSNVENVIKRFNIKTVIMAGNWDHYLRRKKTRYEDIEQTEKNLNALGVKVVFIGQSPSFGFAYPDEYFFLKYGPRLAEEAYFSKITIDPQINVELAKLSSAGFFFDPLPQLCHGMECVFKDGPLYLFKDYGHFSNEGSRRVVLMLLNSINSTSP
jgi:peptidoglycan/LPS O-acetylase OafA/YrhL